MEIFFWGVRGSIATPGPTTVRFGGNTTCVEIRDGNSFILIDCGTGIREAGTFIMKNRGMGIEIPILITHTHWDHIQGFPFFIPAFIPKNKIHMVGPSMFDTPFDQVMAAQMQYSYFPVNFNQLGAEISYEAAQEQSLILNGFKVTPKYVNHPVRTLAYRVEKDNKVICFLTDVEPYYDVIYGGKAPEDEDELQDFLEVQETIEEQNQGLVEFCRNADVLVIDAQYTHAEYMTKRGWGHTSMDDAVQIAHKANARQVLFFHHDPTRHDNELEKLLDVYRQQVDQLTNTSIVSLGAATEGIAVKA
ncbi:MAG: MBL fold metallo-hydrolase [Candidatus Cloacimonetes bacterium]|nr:MBL fold metallo-hydrolase [Candidatus Cloacimonadota bacterium]